jgi:hypothetical protein
MQDIIQVARYMNELGNIMMIKLELLELEQVFNIAQITGDQVIHRDNVKTFFDKPV